MVQPILGRVIPTTLRTEVVGMLRQAIVSGQFNPGDHLKENEVAEQFSVSRSPVREAFRVLEQEGLITSVPNQGCYVKSFEPREIEDIFTIRAALENLAYELVVSGDRLRRSDWAVLDGLIEEQRSAIDEQAFDRLTQLDMEFHEFLIRKTGSERLLQMWQSLLSQIQILFYQRFQALEKVPETVDTDHQAIIVALRTGNIDELCALNKQISARVAAECIAVFNPLGTE